MKQKFLHSLFLSASLLAIYFTMNSNAGGKMGVASTGCGSCHGSASSNTTATVLGLPTTFETGKTYTITVGGGNTTGLSKGGFDLSCSAGSFGANGNTNVMAMGTEIHHTSTKTGTVVSGVGTVNWIITWTAPASPTAVNFNLAYNAVNGTGNDNGDQWNLFSSSVPGAFPASVSTVEQNNIKVYPNPVVNEIFVETENIAKTQVEIFNAQGQLMNLAKTNSSKGVRFDASNIAKGTYIVKVVENGKTSHKHITKN